jgi:tripartite-type tricarboxylate transporter receptor subunit TctC
MLRHCATPIVRVWTWLCVLALAAVALVGMPAPAAAQDFYRGKVVRVIVGFPAGGGFDLLARLLAEHLPRHIPGEPKIIVENMPGATTARAASYVYNVAPQDGSVLGIFHQGLLANQILDVQAGDFDVTRFNWIGRMGTQLSVGLAWHASGAKTIEDAKRTELIFGATTPTATSAMVPRALNALAGTRFKIVTGYQGSSDMYLAMERGETHGLATGVWYDLSRGHADWLKDRKISVLFQISNKRGRSDLASVPALPEFASADDDRKILELLASTEDMGRSFAAGPNVPADRVALLRAGFARMMADPEFLKDAAARNYELGFLPGEELQALVATIGRFPPELAAKAKKALMP